MKGTQSPTHTQGDTGESQQRRKTASAHKEAWARHNIAAARYPAAPAVAAASCRRPRSPRARTLPKRGRRRGWGPRTTRGTRGRPQRGRRRTAQTARRRETCRARPLGLPGTARGPEEERGRRSGKRQPRRATRGQLRLLGTGAESQSRGGGAGERAASAPPAAASAGRGPAWRGARGARPKHRGEARADPLRRERPPASSPAAARHHGSHGRGGVAGCWGSPDVAHAAAAAAALLPTWRVSFAHSLWSAQAPSQRP